MAAVPSFPCLKSHNGFPQGPHLIVPMGLNGLLDLMSNRCLSDLVPNNFENGLEEWGYIRIEVRCQLRTSEVIESANTFVDYIDFLVTICDQCDYQAK